MSDLNSIQLLRCNKSEEWVALKRPVLVQVTESGVVVREQHTNTLLGDFPAPTIQKIEKLTDILIIIDFEGEKIALKFQDRTTAAYFMKLSNNFQQPTCDRVVSSDSAKIFAADSPEFIMPQVADPIVQEFMLKLLFSEDFKDLVNDLKNVLKSMEKNVALSQTP